MWEFKYRGSITGLLVYVGSDYDSLISKFNMIKPVVQIKYFYSFIHIISRSKVLKGSKIISRNSKLSFTDGLSICSLNEQRDGSGSGLLLKFTGPGQNFGLLQGKASHYFPTAHDAFCANYGEMYQSVKWTLLNHRTLIGNLKV